MEQNSNSKKRTTQLIKLLSSIISLTERMRIKSTGNVEIRTSNSIAELQINGRVQAKFAIALKINPKEILKFNFK